MEKGGSEVDDETGDYGEKWRWEGVCFHPPRTVEDEAEGVEEQERELDKGKGGSTIGINDKMGLVIVGCEE